MKSFLVIEAKKWNVSKKWKGAGDSESFRDLLYDLNLRILCRLLWHFSAKVLPQARPDYELNQKENLEGKSLFPQNLIHFWKIASHDSNFVLYFSFPLSHPPQPNSISSASTQPLESDIQTLEAKCELRSKGFATCRAGSTRLSSSFTVAPPLVRDSKLVLVGWEAAVPPEQLCRHLHCGQNPEIP